MPDGVAGGPGMFGQSNPDAITATLHAADYRNVELTPVTVTLALGDNVDDATDYLAKSGPGRAILETVPAEQRSVAIDSVREVLAEHLDGGRVHLDGAIWIIAAERG
jgi:hypothetical protein